MVERLIRNFLFLTYAIDSIFGQGLVFSAYSAWRALIESDSESNSRSEIGFALHAKVTQVPRDRSRLVESTVDRSVSWPNSTVNGVSTKASFGRARWDWPFPPQTSTTNSMPRRRGQHHSLHSTTRLRNWPSTTPAKHGSLNFGTMADSVAERPVSLGQVHPEGGVRF